MFNFTPVTLMQLYNGDREGGDVGGRGGEEGGVGRVKVNVLIKEIDGKDTTREREREREEAIGKGDKEEGRRGYALMVGWWTNLCCFVFC